VVSGTKGPEFDPRVALHGISRTYPLLDKSFLFAKRRSPAISYQLLAKDSVIRRFSNTLPLSQKYFHFLLNMPKDFAPIALSFQPNQQLVVQYV
jgi:hypothetical protein